jgi:hypothetical protein
MEKFKDKNVPVIFQKLGSTYTNEDTDTRFLEVKIWLMHLGQNYNGSFFSKESVEKAIPTLANTPILGYVEADKYGDEDFSDHRSIIVKEDGKYNYKYIGQAYGIIPETNDAKFEKRVGDDGVEREYLTCKGLVWRKNDEAVDIFERDSIKGQSMELHDDFDGEWGEDGLFHFNNFKFFGACALGDNVPPAMESATIEKQFSYKEMHNYIQAKMNEFKQLVDVLEHLDKNDDCNSGDNKDVSEYNLNQKEGGNGMALDNLKNENKDKNEFALSATQLMSEFQRILQTDFEEDDWGWKSFNHYYVDHNENYLFTQSRQDQFRLVGFEYKMNGDKPEIDFESKKLFKIEYSPVEEGAEVNFNFKSNEIVEYELNVKEKEVEKSLADKFTAEKEQAVGEVQVELVSVKGEFTLLEEEVKELREKISTYSAKERKEQEEAVFAKFSKVFNEEDTDFVEVKEKASEFEKIEDLEATLYTLAGKKALESYSKKEEKNEKEDKSKQNVKVAVDFSATTTDENVNPILLKHFSK